MSVIKLLPGWSITPRTSPANSTFDVDAKRVECPLKILVSIPASLRKISIQGIVELTAGLWGSTKLNKS